ncbi:hypothetical protein K439DRAFT_1612168 [Ramaria rubella]|nr:hypothetical protein K439DRAFT_1612168 [Ramaria rubella]
MELKFCNAVASLSLLASYCGVSPNYQRYMKSFGSDTSLLTERLCDLLLYMFLQVPFLYLRGPSIASHYNLIDSGSTTATADEASISFLECLAHSLLRGQIELVDLSDLPSCIQLVPRLSHEGVAVVPEGVATSSVERSEFSHYSSVPFDPDRHEWHERYTSLKFSQFSLLDRQFYHYIAKRLVSAGVFLAPLNR